ncbi:MAG: hypothetical protein LBR31_02470 [Desulfovibrio sp.]|jgi:hypothetical protein|nr:hypothetical protein [Desulfovibrio sp.]
MSELLLFIALLFFFLCAACVVFTAAVFWPVIEVACAAFVLIGVLNINPLVAIILIIIGAIYRYRQGDFN